MVILLMQTYYLDSSNLTARRMENGDYWYIASNYYPGSPTILIASKIHFRLGDPVGGSEHIPNKW